MTKKNLWLSEIFKNIEILFVFLKNVTVEDTITSSVVLQQATFAKR